MIHHTVFFRLRWPPGSAEESAFFEAARRLASLPGVQHFERLRQVSVKNPFSFGFSMQFSDQRAYDDYNDHPLHQEFVRDYWVSQVADFMEVDYVHID
jgi:Stress responsive A/B Barrel Domain